MVILQNRCQTAPFAHVPMGHIILQARNRPFPLGDVLLQEVQFASLSSVDLHALDLLQGAVQLWKDVHRILDLQGTRGTAQRHKNVRKKKLY